MSGLTTATEARGSKFQRTRDLAAASLENLSDALAAGNSESLDRFLKTLGRFHKYSFGNVMLIMSQRPDATRVAGFSTWKDLGRSVRKGEKGIAIIAPMRVKPKEDDPDNRPQVRFKVAHVFDISQTDGEPLPEFESVKGDPGVLLDVLESFISDQGIKLTVSEGLSGADGLSLGGEIQVRESLEPAERFSVLIHEYAHEVLHQGVVIRPPKVVRETEAEAVAHVVCEVAGLSVESAAADYIKLYQGDKETLSASLDRIQTVACRVLDAILPDTTPKPKVLAAAATKRRQR